ncbi:hypothetical protein Mal64_33400 [Pseudobythopirellula maris]|uniref:Uncharacterized protein n=1 Tax=Pseudobythopirellula maris TaxID=2527991 RepID=A0A5C5ZGR7_9BACT|nr:hypothetical protein [Pseudobythopirellula maris]TWT86514.1 hypothetical protein Mal64_33400 [Pseudobythopirellula maris]
MTDIPSFARWAAGGAVACWGGRKWNPRRQVGRIPAAVSYGWREPRPECRALRADREENDG